MAAALAEARLNAVYSLAGRTGAPVLPDLPSRSGGFGGVPGLTTYLQAEGISHVIDATHPFAAQMSRNAAAACEVLGLPLIALERAPWVAGPGDDWRSFASLGAMAAELTGPALRIFLAIGRQNLAEFAGAPQHLYLARLVDPPVHLPLPHLQVEIARGPFTLQGDLALMRGHGTQLVIAKNAGGEAARAKLEAARILGIAVWLAERPALPDRPRTASVAGVMGWLQDHPARLGV